MRNRPVLMLVLAGLLALAPSWQMHRLQAECLNNLPPQGTDFLSAYLGNSVAPVCPYVTPISPFLRGLGILSLFCFACFLFFLVRGIMERRQEQALLRGVGIYLSEDQLPLDE